MSGYWKNERQRVLSPYWRFPYGCLSSWTEVCSE